MTTNYEFLNKGYCVLHGNYSVSSCYQCKQEIEKDMNSFQPKASTYVHFCCMCDEYECKKCRKLHIKCCICGEARIR